jgi:integral membrane protein TIGR01906
MYTLNKLESKNSKKPVNRFLVFLVSLFISLALLISAVKFVFNFRSLYKFDINYLKIEKLANMNKNDILSNYNALIDYINASKGFKLNFPTLAMSDGGRIHFEDVKTLLIHLDYLMYACIILAIIGIIYCIKKKSFWFLNSSAILLILLPIILAIPFAVNFDATFTKFHQLFFSNNYWQFDPVKDPVINMLPEEFFMHCAILILIIVAIESLILFLIHKKIKRSFRNDF